MRKKILKWSVFFLFSVAICSQLRIKHVDYNREIKPLLNKHCLSCHGGVKSQGGFSLLTREDALRPSDSGKRAIVPGNPEASEMIRRMEGHDPETRMPWKKEPLAPRDIALIKQWIKEGARWELHWAYIPVTKPKIPDLKQAWRPWLKRQPVLPGNNIDRFVLDKLRTTKLPLSAKADKRTLAQRASMDLTGIPLADSTLESFIRDSSDQAYSQLIDFLLASPGYGERWAAPWLDIARYADTKGYERDSRRFIWRYRDWVIKSLNDDKPYDLFLTEQLAGDLLPDPTDEQYLATGFHRNTMTNDEGGTDNEEFRVAAVIDRVNTTWTALMGTSFGCVQCHSHPYDPFKQEEYYRFMAFFNNSRDEDTWEDYPALRHFSAADSIKLLNLNIWAGKQLSQEEATRVKSFIKTRQPAIYSIAADSFRNCELYDTKWLTMRNHAQARLKNIDLNGKDQLILRYSTGLAKGRLLLKLDRPEGSELCRLDVKPTQGREIHAIDFKPVGGVHDVWLLYENQALKKPEESGLMFDWLHFTKAFPGKGKPEWTSMVDTFWHLLRAPTEFTPVMMENPGNMQRQTHVFERGNWLSPGAVVQAGIPAVLPPMDKNTPLNRLGMAAWMCDKQNPLVARTLVNRLWEQIFGRGLVETLEDLGSQGQMPSHPELLDYLAWQLMYEYRWSIKKLLREIVLSDTYCRDSKSNEEQLLRDPDNIYLSRGPRVRLQPEQIRDKALAVSGLLSKKMYGPPVMPYQPPGIWKSPWNGDDWKKSTGEDQYRRSVYTFVKRSSPYPSAVTFDLAPREVCAARRIRTNTPLQALVTLNDSVFVETAIYLAEKVISESHSESHRSISRMYELATGFQITEEARRALETLYDKSVESYRTDPEQAAVFLGLKPNKSSGEAINKAALALVANAIMNLDVFIVKT